MERAEVAIAKVGLHLAEHSEQLERDRFGSFTERCKAAEAQRLQVGLRGLVLFARQARLQRANAQQARSVFRIAKLLVEYREVLARREARRRPLFVVRVRRMRLRRRPPAENELLLKDSAPLNLPCDFRILS
jgi:hypothetical protein